MTIRFLTTADTVEFQALILTALEQHPASFRSGVKDIQNTAPPFAAGNANNFTLGAFDDDDKLFGTVSFSREQREKLQHKGWIQRMYVAANSAGKGIGRQLLELAIAEARKQPGLEQINLTVVATNTRAVKLYENTGFVQFSLEPRAIKIGNEYYDEATMVLLLDQDQPS